MASYFSIGIGVGFGLDLAMVYWGKLTSTFFDNSFFFCSV